MEEKSKKTFIIIVIALVILALAAFVGAVIRQSGTFSLSAVEDFLSGIRHTQRAEEFFFDADSKTVCADVNGSFLACSAAKVQLLSPEGTKLYEENLLLDSPAVTASDRYALVYDLGGTYAALFSGKTLLWSKTMENVIISATVDNSGHAVICTQETGYKGSVNVFDKNGKALYKWSSGSGYVLTAAMTGTADLAVLTLGKEGSVITALNLNEEAEKGSAVIAEDMVVELAVMYNGELLAVSDQAVYSVEPEKEKAELRYTFDGGHLAGLGVCGEYLTLYLRDYSVGNVGRLVVLGSGGKEEATLSNDQEVRAMACGGGSVYVLRPEGLQVLSRKLEQNQVYENAAGAGNVIVLADGSAAVIFSHSAQVFS